MQDYAVADIDGVTGKIAGVHRVDDDAFVRGNPALDRDTRLVVKRGWVVHQETVGQRTETGVDVIKARIGQTDGHELCVEVVLDDRVRLDLRAKTEAGPQPRPAPVEQTVARALEADFLIKFEEFEAVFAEPLLEDRLFGPPLHRYEMARDRLIAIDHTGVCGKHHVGQLRIRRERYNIGKLSDRCVQLLPLLFCELQAQ